MYDRDKSVHEEIESLRSEVRRLNHKVSGQKSEKQPTDTYAELSERSKEVLEYIREHPNCTKQDVVDGLEGRIARTPIFNIIDELTDLKIVNDTPDPRNRHSHRLIINNDSLFLSVLEEVDRFKEHFRNLLQKTWIEIEKKHAPSNTTEKVKKEYLDLIAIPYIIVDAIMQSYIIRATMVWPLKFDDKENIVRRLTILVFGRIINLILYEIPKIIVDDTDYFGAQYMKSKLRGTMYLETLSDLSKRFGLDRHMEPILDDLWTINTEVQEDAYPEPRVFSWEGFEYRKDSRKKFLELAKRHSNQRL